jgi:hydrogenase expression/formation protein HypC
MCLAIPGKVLSVTGVEMLRSARVDFGGIIREVNLAYVPEANVGDYVIVHVGFAISKVDEEEANRVFEYLKEMGEFGELAELKVEDPNKAN